MSRGEQHRLQDIKDAIIAIRSHLARVGGEPASEDALVGRDLSQLEQAIDRLLRS